MKKLATLQIQLARFTPDGQPRYDVTRTACGRTTGWNSLTQHQVEELQRCFLEDMRQAGGLYNTMKRGVAA
ncbi:MAG TPA: hypothetical protein VKX49_04290 [Bryobacteraceae bacterium]|nr:hypothetical protein [Bryobacteraceae bacterium]